MIARSGSVIANRLLERKSGNVFSKSREAFARLDFAFPYEGKPFPDLDFTFPDQGKAFPDLDSASPDYEKAFPDLDFDFSGWGTRFAGLFAHGP